MGILNIMIMMILGIFLFNMKVKRHKDRKLIDELKEKHHCIICGNKEVDMHHIKTQGSGGCDADYNLVPLCRRHHQEIGSIGTNKFVEKYVMFEAFLIYFGWELNQFNKWVHKGGSNERKV